MMDIAQRTTAAVNRTTSILQVRLLDQVPLLVLIAGSVLAGLLSNRFATPGNLTNILLQASILSVLAVGMTFVIITGGFDLSIGSTTAMSSCVAAAVMIQTDLWAL